jgi:hypothetical protein
VATFGATSENAARRREESATKIGHLAHVWPFATLLEFLRSMHRARWVSLISTRYSKERRLKLRNRLLVLLMGALMMALSAAPALAQGKPEDVPRGQVEQGPAHANSICSFSGLNDHDPEEPPGGQVQSYGQIVGALAKEGIHVNAGPGPAAPGTECNGHLAPLQEGNPEG